MQTQDYQLLSVGENCIFVKMGNEISPTIHQRVKKLADYLEQNPFSGYVEFVATYTGVAVNYDPWIVKKTSNARGKSSFIVVSEQLEKYIEASSTLPEKPADLVEIPVCYGGEYGPDLEVVAEHCGLSTSEVIKLHSSGEYLCYMIGFCPGFPYLGGMDPRLATPRRQTPRLAIPARSIGIAGQQTGGYPISTPGGWQLIGRSAIELYDAQAKQPTLLKAGDVVKFRSITPQEYEKIRGSRQ
ncbi:MAG TPA: 5-oxoprolinase subunit PxpB [Candidatus Avacidaminococcus intestinavium]|uniref:5-oxoprolinase subunit PxpB n=1 Tax=Candidatus Avacidaminococcus intestinavium TaxID=2840684 RepID=A0A9D1SM03_9FIRM|nr:5-oxoprolinase subunit PxpB [Candidatus Avacidaminococcus intestinavium]